MIAGRGDNQAVRPAQDADQPPSVRTLRLAIGNVCRQVQMGTADQLHVRAELPGPLQTEFQNSFGKRPLPGRATIPTIKGLKTSVTVEPQMRYLESSLRLPNDAYAPSTRDSWGRQPDFGPRPGGQIAPYECL